MTSRTVGRCATRRHAKGIAVGVANQSVSEPDERGQRGAPRLVHAGADKLEATLVAQTVIVQSRISRLSGVNDSALLLEHLSHSCRWPGSRIVPVQRRSEVIPPPTELRRAFFSLSSDPPARGAVGGLVAVARLVSGLGSARASSCPAGACAAERFRASCTPA